MSTVNEIFQVGEPQQMLPREVIKVIGVGGGGGNALNNILASEVVDVDFIAVNTDVAALGLSQAPTRLALGRELTRGRGAGADPERGSNAARESAEDLSALVDGADMVFITAGMGGGTGTGASPVIAEIAREKGALTVAIVTFPFSWEGSRRIQNARKGIETLRDKVDALIVIENDRLLDVCDKNTSFQAAFMIADDVLRQAVSGVTGMIRKPSQINVDFADVCSIMKNAGTAIMGIGESKGDGRALSAARAALNGPMVTAPVGGANGILYFIEADPNVGLDEINEAAALISAGAQADANIIWGWAIDSSMEDRVRFTVIATGFETEETAAARRRGRVNPMSSMSNMASRPQPQQASVRPSARRGEGGLRLNPADLVAEDQSDIFDVKGLEPDDYDAPAITRRGRTR